LLKSFRSLQVVARTLRMLCPQRIAELVPLSEIDTVAIPPKVRQ
jgi:hypothetical protein